MSETTELPTALPLWLQGLLAAVCCLLILLFLALLIWYCYFRLYKRGKLCCKPRNQIHVTSSAHQSALDGYPHHGAHHGTHHATHHATHHGAAHHGAAHLGPGVVMAEPVLADDALAQQRRHEKKTAVAVVDSWRGAPPRTGGLVRNDHHLADDPLKSAKASPAIDSMKAGNMHPLHGDNLHGSAYGASHGRYVMQKVFVPYGHDMDGIEGPPAYKSPSPSRTHPVAKPTHPRKWMPGGAAKTPYLH